MNADWLSAAVSVIAIVVALVGTGRWFRNWIIRTVSEPISKLEQTVSAIDKRTVRTQNRLDRHLEHHNG